MSHILILAGAILGAWVLGWLVAGVRYSPLRREIHQVREDATATIHGMFERRMLAEAETQTMRELAERLTAQLDDLTGERDELATDNARLLAEIGAVDLRLLPVLTHTDDGPALHLHLGEDFSGSVMPVADWVRLLNPDVGPPELEASPEPLTGEIVPAKRTRRRTVAGAS